MGLHGHGLCNRLLLLLVAHLFHEYSTLCCGVAHGCWHAQLVGKVVHQHVSLDGQLAVGAQALADLHVLHDGVDLFHVLSHGQRGHWGDLDLQPVDPQGHVDQAALIHHFQDLGGDRDHGFIDQSAKGRAQVLGQLFHALDDLGGRASRHVVWRQRLIQQDALDVGAQVVDHQL